MLIYANLLENDVVDLNFFFTKRSATTIKTITIKKKKKKKNGGFKKFQLYLKNYDVLWICEIWAKTI